VSPFARSAQGHRLSANRAVRNRFSQLIRPIGRIGPISPILLPPLLNPRGRQTLAVTAPLDELTFQSGNLPVEQVIGLMNQADDRIGDHSRVAVGQPRRVSFRISPIGRINPINPRPNPPHGSRLGIVFSPLPQAALSQEILVVEQQLVQAGPGHIHQSQLGLT
jgi:hypothetical protein